VPARATDDHDVQERFTGTRRNGSTMMGLLEQHVPLTLLLDLIAPPDAEEIYHVEGGPADWLPAPRTDPTP
jgi:hypothetical protein